jgi:hypothetical protein
MQLMDVVITYLYGSLDSNTYMKVPDGISISNLKANRNMYCVKLQKLLYGLKQSGRMWYNRLSEFLKLKGYTNNDDCPCVFIKKIHQHVFVLYQCTLMILISLATNKILMKYVII